MNQPSLAGPREALGFRSAFLRVAGAAGAPMLEGFCVDSLGRGKLDRNLLLPARSDGGGGASRWNCSVGERAIRLVSNYEASPVPPFVLLFDPQACHATLLGLMDEAWQVRLPALLHLPDFGTLRVTAPQQPPATLGFVAQRYKEKSIRIEFPGATAAAPHREYRLEVIDPIHPALAGREHDPRYDGFRRNWLNIFQLQSEARTFANNAASDPVAINVYQQADIARFTPPLIPADPANGTLALTANDLVRQTLDYYLNGQLGYGQPGYLPPSWPWPASGPVYRDTEDFLDAKPSLLIAVHDYVTSSGDDGWLQAHYPALRIWADRMFIEDRDGDGLLEFYVSGNANSYDPKPECPAIRPSNWWDAIGFGHKDAYANALAYRAFGGMAELARRAGAPADADRYEKQAAQLREAYYPTFCNPVTGVLAGWKSADGRLHDYHFTFVNGIAIAYGLVPERDAQAVMDRMQAKFREVGYTHYDFGLPGNLVSVRKEDHAHLYYEGRPQRPDGGDAFQVYLNGGATPCMAYFYIQALYRLGRRTEAEAIFFPMLDAFAAGEYQSFGPNGKSKDWRAWDGTCWGYEGLLVDGYYTLLAAVTGTPPST